MYYYSLGARFANRRIIVWRMRAMKCAAIFLIALFSIVKLTESRASSLRVLEGRDESRDNGVPVMRTLQTTGGGGEEEEEEEEHHDDEGMLLAGVYYRNYPFT
jgi:hypothetical protein